MLDLQRHDVVDLQVGENRALEVLVDGLQIVGGEVVVQAFLKILFAPKLNAEPDLLAQIGAEELPLRSRALF